MSSAPNIAAGILIGGKSVRMGTDKALLPWVGSTMAETVVATALQVAADSVLLGACDSLPQGLSGLKRLDDAVAGIGPIGGLAALLAHYPDRWCLLLGCDIPNVTTVTLSGLIERIVHGSQVVVYDVCDRLEPCCALYHSSILPQVSSAIARRRYKLHDLIRSLPYSAVAAGPATRRALHNINTPADYTPSESHKPPGCTRDRPTSR